MRLPKAPAEPAEVTVPAAAARIGVPEGAAKSRPVCVCAQRAPLLPKRPVSV
ncbi:hypothetical protein [Embleya scabrispora]|uniref:hypothetical protein n=1 Tax=Embleya scabrispora TaxID=159449 RepID=UPI001F2DCB7A|nr:hypothetical protein [Embleya scabrispora]